MLDEGQYTLSGLTAETSYTRYFRAVNLVGNGDASAAVTVTTDVASGPPTVPTNVAGATQFSFGDLEGVFTWELPLRNNPALTRFEYRRNNVGGGDQGWFNVPAPSGQTMADARTITLGFTFVTGQTFELRAVNSEGAGDIALLTFTRTGNTGTWS